MGFRQTRTNKPTPEELILCSVGNHRTLHMEHTVATGGAGATIEIEDNAGETIGDRGGTGITLVLASDTDDAAYDTKSVTVYYINTSGAQKTASATYNAANSTTEVAFTDTTTSVAVSDFVCFDTAHYGTLAVVSTVAVQAGDNVCIGSTGCVAGIADPDICFCKILAAATSPTLANMWGIGAISGDEAANQADTGYIYYIEYVTIYGAIKHGTWTFPADSSASTRFVSVEDSAQYLVSNPTSSAISCFVNDFYRRRESYLHNASAVPGVAIDEIRVGDWDAAAFYEAIEIGQSQACHSRHFVPREADVDHTYLTKAYMRYEGATTEYATVTLTFTIKDQAGTTTIAHKLFGGQEYTYTPDVELEEKTEVKAVVVDDAAAGGNCIFSMDLVEVY